MFDLNNRTMWKDLKFAGIFSFLGGYAAILSTLTFGLFVTCMTGNVTEIGISLSKFHCHEAFKILSVLLAFFIGAFLSAILFDRFGHFPVLLSVSVIFVIIGTNLIALPYAVFMAAIATGMQNSFTTCLSWNFGKMRTTHMTGASTDTAIAIAGKNKKKSFFLGFQLSAYLSGCLVALYAHKFIGRLAFIPGGVIIFTILCTVHYLSRTPKYSSLNYD